MSSLGKVAVFLEYSLVNTPEKVSQIISYAKQLGKLTKARIYLSDKELVQAKSVVEIAERLGIEPIVMPVRDVMMALDVLEEALQGKSDKIIIACSAKLIPALAEAKANKEVIYVAWEDIPIEIKNVVDNVVKMSLR